MLFSPIICSQIGDKKLETCRSLDVKRADKRGWKIPDQLALYITDRRRSIGLEFPLCYKSLSSEKHNKLVKNVKLYGSDLTICYEQSCHYGGQKKSSAEPAITHFHPRRKPSEWKARSDMKNAWRNLICQSELSTFWAHTRPMTSSAGHGCGNRQRFSTTSRFGCKYLDKQAGRGMRSRRINTSTRAKVPRPRNNRNCPINHDEMEFFGRKEFFFDANLHRTAPTLRRFFLSENETRNLWACNTLAREFAFFSRGADEEEEDGNLNYSTINHAPL